VSFERKINITILFITFRCLLDAKPAFKQYSGIEIENNPNGGREFTLIIVHSIFARVHIM
jgi:hypothetical protein